MRFYTFWEAHKVTMNGSTPLAVPTDMVLAKLCGTQNEMKRHGFQKICKKERTEGSTGEIRESKENNRDTLHTRMKFLKKMSIKRVKKSK